MRESDGDDPEHGLRGATLAAELHSRGVLHLTNRQMGLLVEACARHTNGETSSDATIGVCFDSDRLDLPRVGVEVDPAMLSTVAGRRIAVEAFWADAEERWDAIGSGQTLVEQFIRDGVRAFAASHGLPVDEYVAQVERRLRRLAHEAQVRVRVPPEALPTIRAEGLKNTFAASRPRLTYTQVRYRLEWERTYLGLPHDAPATERPVYGYLHSPSWGAENELLDFYGKTILVLDDAVKSRSTVVFGTVVGGERFTSGMPSPLLEPRIGSAFPFDVLDVDFDPRCFTPEVQIVGAVTMDDVVDVTG